MNNISAKKIATLGCFIVWITSVCHIKIYTEKARDGYVKNQEAVLDQKNSWIRPVNPIYSLSTDNDIPKEESSESMDEQPKETDDNDVIISSINSENDVAEIIDTVKTVEDYSSLFDKGKASDDGEVGGKPHPKRQDETQHHPPNTTVHNHSNSTITYVIADVGCHQGLHMVLENIFRYAKENDKVAFWHSKKNEAFLMNGIELHPILKQKLKDGKMKFHKIEATAYNFDQNQVYSSNFWYSILLTHMDLWGTIDTDIAITMQGDTLICHLIEESMIENFSYLGGPSPFYTIFMAGRKQGAGPLDRKIVKHHFLQPNPDVDRIARFHLNGGFSIRNVTWVKECIKVYGTLRQWTEDDLYTYCVAHLPSSIQNTEDKAYAVSSDNGNTKCFTYKGKRRCPFGVHKPWELRNDAYDELEEHCPGVNKLQQRQTRFVNTKDCNVQFLDDELPTNIECDC